MHHNMTPNRLPSILNTKHARNQPNTSKAHTAPQARLVLQQRRVALGSIYSLDHSAGQGQADAATNLEGRVDHASAHALDVHRDRGEQDDSDGAVDDSNSSDAQDGRGEHVLPEADVAVRHEGPRDGRDRADDHARDEQPLRVADLEGARHAQAEDKARAAHRQEPQGRLPRAEVVDLLGHEGDEVDCSLIPSIHDEPPDPKGREVLEPPEGEGHNWVGDLLLDVGEGCYHCDAEDEQHDDEGLAPAILAAAGQNEAQKDQTRGREPRAGEVELRPGLPLHPVAGEDECAQEADDAREDDG